MQHITDLIHVALISNSIQSLFQGAKKMEFIARQFLITNDIF